MEIVLLSIEDRGDITNERIGFKALKNLELKYYFAFKTIDDKVGFFGNKSNNCYWFLPTEVKQGDKVVLYTRAGQESISENSDGTKTYFFYWGLSEPIFSLEKDNIVIGELKDWKMFK